jgi:hypothetical protein
MDDDEHQLTRPRCRRCGAWLVLDLIWWICPVCYRLPDPQLH